MAALGLAPRAPFVSCDGPGCDATVTAETDSGLPKSWLLNRKAPPGWRMERVEEPFSRKDFCKACREQRPPKESP